MGHIFYTKGRDYDGSFYYNSNGFTVLKGSVIAQTMFSSFNGREKRESFLQEYAVIDGDKRIGLSQVQEQLRLLHMWQQ